MGKEQEFVSKITKNPCQDNQLFDFMSDFRNLSSILPPEAKDKISTSKDTIEIQAVAGFNITLKIIEKEPYKLLKIGTENNGMFCIWIQLKQVAPYDTRIRITLRANIPLVARPMMSKEKMQGFVDSLAEALANIPVYAFQGNNQNN